jgi:O-antigen/teichoic acid export membrane protein
VLFSVLCFAVVLIAPECMLILGGAKYKESIYVIPPLIAAVLFMEMYNLFSMIEFYYKKTVKIMFATLMAAVVNVVMNYFAIKQFGYIAAAYTTLICYIAYCIFHYLNMRSIEPRKIYNIRFLTLYSIGYVVACLLCLLIYPYTVIRFILLGLIFIALLVNRKKIMKLLRVGKDDE